jgi:Protein of unknown function (DUF1573)
MLKLGAAAVLALLASTGSAAAQDVKPVATSGPRLVIEPDAFDFGKALTNKTLRHDFQIRNVGTEDLVVDKITTNCGCTAALLDDKVLKPGASATLRVDLQTLARAGRFERTIALRSNDHAHDPYTVTVRATVVQQGSAP